ncbi:hypothetical protein MKEN_00987000 [Mycena kentingensis (nom. inval.)]|nr:hypothetical protein MKEN_00987000 [Mycena kentingensis (nom. inval.)]
MDLFPSAEYDLELPVMRDIETQSVLSDTSTLVEADDTQAGPVVRLYEASPESNPSQQAPSRLARFRQISHILHRNEDQAPDAPSSSSSNVPTTSRDSATRRGWSFTRHRARTASGSASSSLFMRFRNPAATPQPEASSTSANAEGSPAVVENTVHFEPHVGLAQQERHVPTPGIADIWRIIDEDLGTSTTSLSYQQTFDSRLNPTIDLREVERCPKCYFEFARNINAASRETHANGKPCKIGQDAIAAYIAFSARSCSPSRSSPSPLFIPQLTPFLLRRFDPTPLPQTPSHPCIGLYPKWDVGDIWTHFPHQLRSSTIRHPTPYSIISYEPLGVRSDRCKAMVSIQGQCCSSCAALSLEINQLRVRAAREPKGLTTDLLSWAQLRMKLEDRDTQIRSMHLRIKDLEESLQTARSGVSHFEELYSYLQETPAWGVRETLRRCKRAVAGGYHPENWFDWEIDLALLTYEIGGLGLVHALHKSMLQFPCRTTLQKLRVKAKLQPCISGVRFTDVYANISTYYSDQPDPAVRYLHTACFDETAKTAAIDWFSLTDEFGGLWNIKISIPSKMVLPLAESAVELDASTVPVTMTASRDSTWSFTHAALCSAWTILYDRILSDESLHSQIPRYTRVVTSNFPYQHRSPDGSGGAFSIPIKGTPIEAIFLDAGLCRLCGKKCRAENRQNHVGEHILRCLFGIVDPKLKVPIATLLPCGFCGGPGAGCSISIQGGKARSTCPLAYKFLVRAAASCSDTKPSTNVPIKCPYMHCDEIHWKYNFPQHLDRRHQNWRQNLPEDSPLHALLDITPKEQDKLARSHLRLSSIPQQHPLLIYPVD